MSKYFEITLECLLNIIYFDIDNTFFTVGNQIYKQIKGVPMGSHLSPALAYLICEYYERRIPLTIPPQRLQFIFGGRYMDDILIVRLTPKDPDDPLHKLLDNDLLRITDTQRKGAIYHKDLTIKQEYASIFHAFFWIKYFDFIWSNTGTPLLRRFLIGRISN